MNRFWEWCECPEGHTWEAEFYEDETGTLIPLFEDDMRCPECGQWDVDY